MTLCLWNARSEFVIVAKPSGDGTCEIMRRFQIAEPASCRPALRPTRGSGSGARTSGADMSAVDMAAPAGITDGELELPAQAAMANAAPTPATARVRGETTEGVI